MLETNPQELSIELGGRYRLLHPIGQGGMSTVYLAEDMKLPGKRWAVKQYDPIAEELSDPHGEASLLLSLSHPYLPHIVDFFPLGPASAHSYLVMEYIEGETLQQWLDRQTKQPPIAPIVEIGLQACELLQYLHGREPAPVVYRDLKPANLMLDKQGRIRLIDFGIARNYKPGQRSDTVPLGTVAFAAPEQLNQTQTDPRSDLYSLGALMYYLLSGGHYYAVAMKPLRQLRNDVRESLADVVHRLLEHDPGDRYQSAALAKTALYRTSAQMDTEFPESAPVPHIEFIAPRHISAAEWIKGAGSSPRLHLPDLSASAKGSAKLIVVGALYAGAGATFATIALARLCSRMGLSNVVIEAVANEPELAALIGIPPQSDPHARGIAKGGTRWVALPHSPQRKEPGAFGKTYIADVAFEQAWLHSNEAIRLVDISNAWADDGVESLCLAADAVVVVIDPFPSKWDTASSVLHLQLLRQWTEQKGTVRWLMNKDAPHARRKERLGCAPAKPAAILPYIPPELRLLALDKGKLIQDLTGVRETLDAALSPLLLTVAGSSKKGRRESGKRISFWSFF